MHADVVLISCYELGHQPFNLASPLALLAQRDIEATVVDLAVHDISEKAAEVIGARFVGISVPMHTALRLGEVAARRVRSMNPEVHICFYGYYAELNAVYLLNGIADTTIAGEYEPALLTLVEAVLCGSFDPADPPDYVSTRKRGGKKSMLRVNFAAPQRGQLPSLENYARLRSNGDLYLAGHTETTRGCKYTCSHCPVTPIYNGRFFVVPQEIVLEDIRAQVAQGARHITFGDPDFLNGPGHARRIVRALHTEFPQITFDFTARIPHLLRHAELLPEMAASGCAFVVSALESLSDDVLTALEKGHTRDDIICALALMDRVGIPLRPSLVPFTPWTTQDDYLELLALVRDYDLVDHIDPVQYTIRLLIPPGSALLNTFGDAEWIGELDRANYSYTWTHPDSMMDEMQVELSSLVAQATRKPDSTRQIFATIEDMACLMMSAPRPAPRIIVQRRPIPAGLTESWFC